LDYREGVLKDNMKTIFTDCFTGAKGAGKTSLIQSIQKRQFSKNRDVLFLNEKGSIPYSVSNPDFLRIYPILGGCICCSGQTELIHFMQESMAKDNPERFIIELCGAGRIKDLLPLLHLIPTVLPDYSVIF
jgi:G3E family GTPase